MVSTESECCSNKPGVDYSTWTTLQHVCAQAPLAPLDTNDLFARVTDEIDRRAAMDLATSLTGGLTGQYILVLSLSISLDSPEVFVPSMAHAETRSLISKLRGNGEGGRPPSHSLATPHSLVPGFQCSTGTAGLCLEAVEFSR